MYSTFHLILMVNHNCNLRCSYCFTGAKSHRPMLRRLGRRAIVRGLRSISAGGTFELGFFGGEPLLEAESVLHWLEFAEKCALRQSQIVRFNLTTNGTVDTPSAWQVMTHPGMQLSVSHDGLPAVHDRHRLLRDDRGSSEQVLNTIDRLISLGIDFSTITVVRPDTVESLAEGLSFLWKRGVKRFDLSLDLWSRWSSDDVENLQRQIDACAVDWWQRLPEASVNWFDEKLGKLAQLSEPKTARCGFGVTQIAVAPSGNIYPCERLIGEDELSNASRLTGHVTSGRSFLASTMAHGDVHEDCRSCILQPQCATSCQCSNYIRTGNAQRPDRLLCVWDQACLQAVARLATANC